MITLAVDGVPPGQRGMHDTYSEPPPLGGGRARWGRPRRAFRISNS